MDEQEIESLLNDRFNDYSDIMRTLYSDNDVIVETEQDWYYYNSSLDDFDKFQFPLEITDIVEENNCLILISESKRYMLTFDSNSVRWHYLATPEEKAKYYRDNISLEINEEDTVGIKAYKVGVRVLRVFNAVRNCL